MHGSYGGGLKGVCLAACAFVLMTQAVSAQSNQIRIGQFFDLTGGGASSAEGALIATNMAIAEINATGGIVGKQIVKVNADTQTDPTVGVSEMRRLLTQEKVEVVLGPVISQVLQAAAPILNGPKVVTFGWTGSDAITTTVAPYHFSLAINIDSQAKAMLQEAIKTLKVKSAAILSDSGAQAKSFVQSMRREMEAQKIALVGTQEYQYRATDMIPQILALRRGNPDVIFLVAVSGEDTGHALKAMQEVQWNVKVIASYGATAFATEAMKVSGPGSFKNVTGMNFRFHSYCTEADKPKAFLEFVRKAKAFDANAVGRLSPLWMSVFYDATYLLKAAIEGTGGKTDGPTLSAWIEANAPKYSNILTGMTPSKTNHFLFGADALAAVHPDQLSAEGLQRRVGC